MTTPRAIPCRYLRMRPLAFALRSATERKPISAAICENASAITHGKTLQEDYEANRWSELETCRLCAQYNALRP